MRRHRTGASRRPARRDDRPVLFVTNFAPAYRVPSFASLHAREDVRFALIGGRVQHGGAAAAALPFPVTHPSQRGVARLAASGRFRAVVSGLSGRVAPLAAWAGARAAGVPFVLWATLWAHPRTPGHLLSFLPVRGLYRDADAVATYGPHVSAYVRAAGARAPVVEAPQAVDVDFWSGRGTPDRRAPFQALFLGRDEPGKGADVLRAAWAQAALPHAALVMERDRPPDAVRNLYGGSDVVVVPSLPTRAFREPWGLVVNEAFHQEVPVIATDAVGAAAGGLVVHEETGLVVPAGDARALAAALRRLHGDPGLRARLVMGGRAAVDAYSPDAWAAGMSRALSAAGASRAR